jgi:histone-lysine N-methyltransferase SETD3
MRGVHTKSHAPPNTLLMSIPRRCLITVEMGQATPIGQAILHADLDLDAPKHIFLMIYLLWDRKVNGSTSFFYPYYEILPQTLHNMPIFWTRQELAELDGSYLQHQIADRNQAITEDYNAICQVSPQMRELCTLDEFKWARMCVCSRNFGLQMDGHRTSALVPHADMLNHYRPRETKWTFDEDRQAFTITSLQHIGMGAQVYDSYGQKCNHRFLLNYGFAVEDNRELDGFCPNEVPLELYVAPDDLLFTEKLEFWTRGEQMNPAGPAARILDNSYTNPVVKRIRVCISNNENTRLLFSLLRALACNTAELHALASPVGVRTGEFGTQRGLFGLPENNNNVLTGSPVPHGATYHRSCRDIRHPVSLRNERAAMRLLLQVVDRHLSSYPTQLAQDMADLMDESRFPRFSNKRHAKIQVRGEKEVLHHFAQWARTALDVLDVLEEELQEERGGVEVAPNGRVSVAEERPGFECIVRRMDEESDIHHTILRYCADVLGSLRREEFKNIRRQRAQMMQRNSCVN